MYFSLAGSLYIAIGIERNGAAFYHSLAKSTGNEIAKGVYEYLAGEELKHIEQVLSDAE